MARTQISTALISNSGPAAIVPSGTILDFGGPTAPSGWTECNGSAISRTTFSTLFSAIGTTWGVGDGSTTFNVPDLRRRTTVGRGGASTGTLGNTIGSIGGEEAHVQITSELATHNHSVTDPGHNHTVSDPGHNHTVSDPGHNHSQNSHGHGISDPGHTHTCSGGLSVSAVTHFATTSNTANTITTNSATTGISVNAATATNNAATTGISNNSNTTGISNNSNTTGISTNNNGSGTAANVIQPSAVVIKIIKN
jgi:microcystin-dependent protein